MMPRYTLFASLLWAVFYTPSIAQTPDPDFHSPVVIKGAKIADLIIQPDDKVLVSGTININDIEKVNTLVRLNHDGTIDQTFSLGVDMAYGIGTIRLQNNGDILFATSEKRIGRLSSTGDLLSLVTLPDAVNDICIQPDSKILVAGGNKLMRYNEDLTVDNTFTTVSANAAITIVKLQNTGIIIGGKFSGINSVAKNYLARITDTGTVDLSFHTEASSGEIRNFLIQPDDKILLTNSNISFSNGVQKYGLFRLNQDGSFDSGFNTAGNSTTEAIFQGGKIIIATYLQQQNGPNKDQIMRLDYDGSIDQTFAPIELETFASIELSLALASDQSFIADQCGNLGNHHGIVKFTDSGLVNNSFQPELTVYGDVLTGDFKDGKLLIGGEFIKVNGFSTYNVAMLNADGSVDETFRYDQYETSVQQVEILNDQNILITGKDLVKLSPQGLVIPEFDFLPFNYLYNVWKFIPLENGKILAGGPNNPPNLLNADGSKDLSLDFPYEAMCCWRSTAFDFDRQSTGKVLFGSVFTEFNGTSVNRLLRLNTDGSVDLTFNTGTGPHKNNAVPVPGPGANINMVKTLSTDHLIVAGNFDRFDDFVCNGLVKLSPDGALDKTFTTNVIPDFHFPQLVEEFDDKLLFIENSYDLTGPIALLKPRNLDGTMNENFDLPQELGFKVVEDIDTSGTSLFLFGKMKLSENSSPACVVKLNRNIPPVITATSLTTIAEDNLLEIDLSDFTVADDDPADVIELSLLPGAHYSIHEHTLTPEANYSGDITVYAKADDGDKSSPVYEFRITVTPVNDQPEIINVQQALVVTKGVPLQINLEDIEVLDPDNPYPAGFTLTIFDGDNYSVISNSIICDPASTETIQVTLKVNDGTVDSELFSFPVAVNVITGIEQGASDELVIYPNPVKQIAEFRYKGQDAIQHITLINVSGQEILKSTFSDNGVGQMDVSELPPGLYIARIATEKKVITRKIQKTF
jgi:uncharacterized delta-60 repeat protein